MTANLTYFVYKCLEDEVGSIAIAVRLKKRWRQSMNHDKANAIPKTINKNVVVTVYTVF